MKKQVKLSSKIALLLAVALLLVNAGCPCRHDNYHDNINSYGIDLPDNKFIITNLDLPEDELIDMYYNGLYNDLACDCPLCKNNNN